MTDRPYRARTCDTLIKSQVLWHPIIFSSESVRAILDGRKTQTRRVIKPQPTKQRVIKTHHPRQMPTYTDDNWIQLKDGTVAEIGSPAGLRTCPYGQAGDRLWVRETWGEDYAGRVAPAICGNKQCFTPVASVVYKADNYTMSNCGTGWKSSIFMPRWASRILLEITGVRAERVQEITERDAMAEGVNGYIVDKLSGGNDYRVFREYHHEAYPLVDHADVGDIVRFLGPNLGYGAFQSKNPKCNAGSLSIPRQGVFDYIGSIEPDYKRAFRILWDSLNAKRGYGWEKNNLVWPISFKLLDAARAEE